MKWKPPTGVNSIPGRLQTIFDANIRSAYSAGQWARIQRTKEFFPYLLYAIGPSKVHRAHHLRWNGTLLPADHEWWDTHFAPNGWGCKCRIIQVNESQRKRLIADSRAGREGIAGPQFNIRTTAPDGGNRLWINPRDGKPHYVPVGIDPGWDWNPGKHRVRGVMRAFNHHLEKMANGTLFAGAGAAAVRERIHEYLGSAAFYYFVSKPPRGLRSKPGFDPRAASDDFAPLGVISEDERKKWGASTHTVRFYPVMADKMDKRHGPSLPKISAIKMVPWTWYRDIQAILDRNTSYKQSNGRWAIADDSVTKRLLVVDLDNDRNPVFITYYLDKDLLTPEEQELWAQRIWDEMKGNSER